MHPTICNVCWDGGGVDGHGTLFTLTRDTTTFSTREFASINSFSDLTSVFP